MKNIGFIQFVDRPAAEAALARQFLHLGGYLVRTPPSLSTGYNVMHY